MRTKTCAWGTCKSDSRYSDRPHMAGVTFRPFPKPKTQLEMCREWIRLCNRPHKHLNVNKVKSYTYVCSKHFKDDTSRYPQPAGDATPVRERKPPTVRGRLNSPPGKQKKRKAAKTIKREISPSTEGHSSKYGVRGEPLMSSTLCATKTESVQPPSPCRVTAKPPPLYSNAMPSTILEMPPLQDIGAIKIEVTENFPFFAMMSSPCHQMSG